MSIKKNISKTIVFAAVFVGTLISEGISVVTISAPGKKLAEKAARTIKGIRAEVYEQFHIATAKVIEESAFLNAKIKKSEVGALLQTAKKKP